MSAVRGSVRKFVVPFVLFLALYANAQYTADKLLQEELIERQEQQIRIVTFTVLLPVLVLFVFGFFFFYRQRRESYFRERELELKFARSEMEMRALRAQVNPHFIFNSLSSIQHAIHHKNTEQAERHLVKFSRLIRQVLEHSSSAFISLGEDLEILELYIELEALRLEGRFKYEVLLDQAIDRNEIFVPPLLLQPLVENAIWHGLSNRQRPDGKLTLQFNKVQDQLVCNIIDNGVKKEGHSNHGGESHGLRLVRERIRLHTQEDQDDLLQLEELIDPAGAYLGMKVKVAIPTED